MPPPDAVADKPASVAGPITHLLYLHGFRSSPQSAKARLLTAHVSAHFPALRWWCPQLPPSPLAAMALVREVIDAWPHETMGVIGSSLGGFYAGAVAEYTGCRAVLLNPAVDPARDLATQVGEHAAWHDPAARFVFRTAYLDELRALQVARPTRRERYWPLIAQGDEVLDWREMAARYPGAPGRILPGGDHGLSDFALYVDEVLAFFGLVRQGAAPAAPAAAV